MNIDLNRVEIAPKINFNVKGAEEILQNLKILFSTPAGTVPFDREFGIDWDILDRPVIQAKAALTTEYVEKVRRFEPRARVKEISFSNDAVNGILIPKVVIEFVQS